MTEGTGVAVAAYIPEKKLVRVLVIDDAVTFQQDMIDYFDTYDYSVDVARDPLVAQALLRKNRYQIVLIDVNFEGLAVQGDSFAIQNFADFKGARVIIVTGLEVNTLRYRKALDKLKIPVWDKSSENWERDLTGLTEKTAAARRQEIAGRMKDVLSDELGDMGSYVVIGTATTATAAGAAVALAPAPKPVLEPWEVEVKDILIGWLEKQSHLEQPLFYVGRREFSAGNMVEQVQEKTDIGKQLLEMFAAEIRFLLGLENRSTSGR